MIANRVLEMSLELFKYPYRMVDEISALGLRHVGYAVPIEFFGPFVSACIETVQSKLQVSESILESFAWSLGVVSRMLVRTIKEGSTIVMKAPLLGLRQFSSRVLVLQTKFRHTCDV